MDSQALCKLALDAIEAVKGQDIVEGVGYYPLPKEAAAAAE